MTYDDAFYDGQAADSQRSASRVLTLVRGWLDFNSIVDVGCGVGTWLCAAARLGVRELSLTGLDGNYVNRKKLLVPDECFLPTDLASPFALDRGFDLALSLEVAEHLPLTRAASLVNDICALSSTVLFGAAIPGQGGTGHVNEQWPDFWAGLFSKAGMLQLDVVRPAVWDDQDIKWWYRQNTFLYSRDTALCERLSDVPSFGGKRLVHPEAWSGVLSRPLELTGRQALSIAGKAALRRILQRTG